MIVYTITIKQVGSIVQFDAHAPGGKATTEEVKLAKKFSELLRRFQAEAGAECSLLLDQRGPLPPS